ncbi:50S ribosomal protein L3 N(5)-glutamine methyltransferase [Tepidicella xavieri]|uniref:[LSU ribosomal protein L3P]-glutamine N5-methyltransferase n=1 Tax=Tepidicella xavieri TaxID=360241 RepID=A0A4R6UEI8_9BURK|nr:50S ribosomal protein L3 N(5)-glutamine methyltransferase [Tepidicella xavieri]TDQ43569.1 [LSU ribosomal protein L3P]-glutamine N5-methyltransferase [Tepidicella xavieri]
MQLRTLIDHSAAALQAADLSYGHGTTNAYDEAVWLVLWRLGLPLDSDLHALGPNNLSPEQVQAVQALIEQRIRTRQPAAYLTREAWLQGVPFYVDERVIVPRSFIAELIADAEGAECLDPWLGEHTRRVLDLCTGNGSLAVLAALAWPEVSVDASDISADALAVARINLERHGLTQRVRLIQSDGWTGIDGRYDLILCNPPYVSRASMQALPDEYRAEPQIALDGGLQGGEDGMDFVRHLLRHALAHMNDDAVLVLEIGNERAHFERAFPGLLAYWPPTTSGEGPVLILTQQALLDWQAQRHAGPQTAGQQQP